jgi:D-alanyl-D-alanine carboxypeptidase/D-alanyl-D-alanine-endopeptidase (penicillin-binding protein 4)
MRWCCLWVGLFGVIAANAQTTNPPVRTLEALREQLSAHVNQPRFAAALWGVKIVSLETGRVLFEQNPEKLFSPASNSKLYTMAMVLDRLGPDYRIRTSLYATNKPEPDGTLKGDLVVYGRGDPSINSRRHGGDIFAALQPLVAALTNAGVRRITGSIVGDATYFSGPEYGSGWAWDDSQSYYGAEISALTINDNIAEVAIQPGAKPGDLCQLSVMPATDYQTLVNRTETGGEDSRKNLFTFRPLGGNTVYVMGKLPVGAPVAKEDVTVANPERWFVELFRAALAKNGVECSGSVRTVNWLGLRESRPDCQRMAELGSVESPPMRELLREVQKPSQNLYTDLLLAHAGETRRTSDTSPEFLSEELGIRELNRFLAEAGIEKEQVIFEEGSGLSRNNLASPNATVALLGFMKKHRFAEVYFEALPVAGVDGTLRNRMKETPAAGKVRAKTGTLRWAHSLSGEVTTAAGEHLLFSIMLNRYLNNDTSRPARAELDAIAVLLAEFEGKS